MAHISRHPKRLNRVAISLDDETFSVVCHLANFENRAPSEYLARLIEGFVHGAKERLQAACDHDEQDRCCDLLHRGT